MLRLGLVVAVTIALMACTPPASNPRTQPASPYTLQPDYGEMSASEIQQAFSQLGLSIQRFTYEAPANHTIEFSFDYYENGVLIDNGSEGTAALEAGTNTITVYRRREGNDLVFSFGFPGGSVGVGRFALPENAAIASAPLGDVDLTPGWRVPICYVGANEGGISSTGDESIEEMASQMEMLVVVNVTRM